MVRRRAIAAAVGGAAAFLALLPTISQAATAATPVDRQVYSTVGNQDPYSQGVDCTPSIHVATTAGQATATAFVHVALDALPAGAKATGVVLTLKLNCDTATQYGSPNLYACVLTEELKATAKNGDPAPKEDCNTKVAGKLAADGKSWSFELGPLVSYWNSHSNTGLSIHDQPANPAASNSVAFDSALSTAQTTFTPAASSSSGGTTYSQPYTVPNSNSGAGTSFSAPGGAGVLTVPDQPAANAPAASGSPQAKANNAPTTTQTGPPTVQGFPLWALILVGSAAAAAALLVQPIAHALSNSTGPVAGFVIQLRGHPRLFATAGVLTIWSASYGTYALAHPGSGGIPGLTTPGSNGGGGDSANGSNDGSNPSAAPGSSGPGAAAQGPGSTKKFGNTSVFVPDNGGVPVANLFPADQDRIGITNDTVTLCGHSALTFGPAFNVSASDLNVFWQNLNDHGGVYNRKFNVSWNDDQYKPGPAVTAAQKCMDAGTFFLMGGIGFDQIPAVRVWAEQHHELYIHHMAVAQGSQGLRYSYTALPTVEQAGTMFGELYLSRYRGQKVGIIYRNSPNWDPGRAAFHQVLASAGQEGNIVAEDGVNANQGSYAKEISDMSTHSAQLVWSWENALGALEMIKQAKQQTYNVPWMVFPFNITLQGLTGDQGYNPPITGVAAWDAYTFGHTEGSYGAYASDIREFEREYAQYDSGANLNGPGGDLLFLAWSEFKGIAALMQACGKDCTRNKIAGLMLAGMKATVPPNCPVNFSDGHHGSNLFDIFETWNNGGNAAWRETSRCISRL